MGIWTQVRTLVIRLVFAQSIDSVDNGNDGTIGDFMGEAWT
jgi:hypothetical protein